jgi:hypothetical protein
MKEALVHFASWTLATRHVRIEIAPPEGVLPVDFGAMVERKVTEIEEALNALAKRKTK